MGSLSKMFGGGAAAAMPKPQPVQRMPSQEDTVSEAEKQRRKMRKRAATEGRASTRLDGDYGSGILGG